MFGLKLNNMGKFHPLLYLNHMRKMGMIFHCPASRTLMSDGKRSDAKN